MMVAILSFWRYHGSGKRAVNDFIHHKAHEE
jgi:hypothetical protein